MVPFGGITMSDKKSLSAMKTTSWSLTHWLTEGRTLESLLELVQQMPPDWHLEGQIEQGADSQQNLHAQLYLKTPQTRGTRIAKFFPHTHIEESRNRFANQAYVHKEDTRVAEFKTIENRSPQWHVVCDKFFDWVLQEKTDNGFFGVVDEERMKLWDIFIGLSIREGMRVDIIGVNPQYRSCIQRYWLDYIDLAKTRLPVDKCLDKTNSALSIFPTSVDKCLDKTNPALSPGGGIPRVKKVVKVFLPKE